MSKRILLILVILSVLFLIADGHWWGRRHNQRKRRNRHCPSSDDEDHVCCEWKTKTYQIPFSECSACTTPTPENELCWYSRRRQQYFCWYTYFMNVTKVECEAKCCDGWTIDEHGQCSVRADEQQDIVCENGGSPAGDYCSCPIGFVGTHCETAVCTPICLNNGVCGGRDGKAVCICPERNFTGEQCEIPVCDPKCKNGGSCVETGYESKCACTPGFTGQSCEKKIKDGECPDTSGISTCQVECDDDFQCPGRKKCCINGCGGGVCVYPANTTCTHSGQQYPVGHITVMSPCKMCYCFDPNSQGDKQWMCAVMDCPILLCEHRKTIPDVCCPVCDDAPTTVRTTTRTSRIPTTRISRISTTRFPTTRISRIPTTRFPPTRIPTTPKPTCHENGQEYPVGHVISSNNYCDRCTCGYDGMHIVPDWSCMFTDCIEYPHCEKIRHIPGQCCPVCDDTTTNAPTTIVRTTRVPTTTSPTTFNVPTTVKPTTRTSRIPTTRFPTTPKTTCQEDGKEYPVGHVISRNNDCERCTCGYRGRNRDPDWMCMVTDCFGYPHCEKIRHIPGQCCPVCDDTTTNAPTTIVRTTRVPTTTSPTTFTCSDNGIQYPGGAVITRNDNCASCVCTWEKYHIVPGWKCKNTKCPMLTCLYTRKIEGTCCEVCAEPPTTLKPEITTNHPRGCRFNGTDYPHMAEIRKSDCESCRCYYQYGGHMNWECRISDCASPPCQNPIKRPGQCCPVCLGTSSTTTPRSVQTTLSPDNAPYFKHCPKERLILSTLGRNYVDIRAQVNLTVVDKSGKKYAVRYSETLITAKPCNCSENYHIIIARSEVDKYGRFASCMFNVHVFDNNPPVYKTCPTSIAAFEDEIITWDIPEAYDNVAIKSEKFKSLHENNSKFKVGSHVVMYILIDDQGNIGICNFLVAIYERGTTDPTAPLELKNGDEKDKRVLINVVIGALTGLIALTMIAIVFAFYRRRRNQNLASGNAHPVSGYDNGIYATPNTPPPSYGRSSGAKLPPKYMVRDDKLPVYEEVDVKALSQKKGVQNPIYDSTDDLDLGQRIRPKLEMKEETNA